MSVEAASLLRLEKTSLREHSPLCAVRSHPVSSQPSTHLVETELSDALQIVAERCGRPCANCSRRG